MGVPAPPRPLLLPGHDVADAEPQRSMHAWRAVFTVALLTALAPGTRASEEYACNGSQVVLGGTPRGVADPDDISDFLDAGSFSCATTGVSRAPGCRQGRGGSSCGRDPDDCKAGGALSWDQAGGDALRDQLPVLIADLTGAVDPNASGRTDCS